MEFVRQKHSTSVHEYSFLEILICIDGEINKPRHRTNPVTIFSPVNYFRCGNSGKKQTNKQKPKTYIILKQMYQNFRITVY